MFRFWFHADCASAHIILFIWCLIQSLCIQPVLRRFIWHRSYRAWLKFWVVAFHVHIFIPQVSNWTLRRHTHTWPHESPWYSLFWKACIPRLRCGCLCWHWPLSNWSTSGVATQMSPGHVSCDVVTWALKVGPKLREFAPPRVVFGSLGRCWEGLEFVSKSYEVIAMWNVVKRMLIVCGLEIGCSKLLFFGQNRSWPTIHDAWFPFWNLLVLLVWGMLIWELCFSKRGVYNIICHLHRGRPATWIFEDIILVPLQQ